MLGGSGKNSEARTTIIVPCYNESTRWRDQYWHEILSVTSAELIFVNDGSTDTTIECIKRFQGNPRVSRLDLGRNVGKAEAVRLGMLQIASRASQGPAIVGFLDADGAFDPADVQRLIILAQSRFTNGYEALWSSRVALRGREISRSMSRHYIGRVIATFLSASVPDLPYDSQSGFKLFRNSSAFLECLRAPFRTRWLFDIEILERWRDLTGASLPVWEEPVMAWRDVPGSKIRGTELTRIAGEIFSISRSSRSQSKRSAE